MGRAALLLLLLSATVAAAAAPPPCDPRKTSASGEWRDPRHGATHWSVAQDAATLRFTCKGPWPGSPHGQLYQNGSLWLEYSASNTATGVISPGCDVITWTDPPDRKAGNTWCRVGSAGCAQPPKPPPPAPPGPPSPPRADSYPALTGGSFSGQPVSASPDPLVSYRWEPAAIVAQQFQTYRRQVRASLLARRRKHPPTHPPLAI